MTDLTQVSRMVSALVVTRWVLPAASASRAVRLWSLGTARTTMTLGGSTVRARSRSSRLRGATRWRALLCAVALVCWEVVPECAVRVLCVSVSSVSLCLAPVCHVS